MIDLSRFSEPQQKVGYTIVGICDDLGIEVTSLDSVARKKTFSNGKAGVQLKLNTGIQPDNSQAFKNKEMSLAESCMITDSQKAAVIAKMKEKGFIVRQFQWSYTPGRWTTGTGYVIGVYGDNSDTGRYYNKCYSLG
jgi:hypothetical protein